MHPKCLIIILMLNVVESMLLQIVVEVKDVDGRLAQVTAMLESRGMHVRVEPQISSMTEAFMHFVPAALALFLVFGERV